MDSSKIKVLMFGWEFPPFNSGGLGVACHGLAQALVNDEVDVTFVLPRKLSLDQNDKLKFLFADKKSVTVKTVDSLLTEYITVSAYSNKLKFIKNSIYGSTLFEEVKRYAINAKAIAKSEGFNVIHAHDWLAIPAGIIAKEESGKPLVVHFHATEFDRSGGQGVDSRVFDIEKEGIEYADKIIAVSNHTKRILVDKYDAPEEKIEVIHNAVSDILEGDTDVDLRNLKENYKIVLFVGRLTIQKGADIFLQTAKKVLEHYRDVVFVVAGSGDMKEQLVNEAVSLGIADRVIFTGFLRGASLRKLYASADLYVMPSISEPFGITALESLISGTPVLLSKQSGASEVIIHSLKSDFWDRDEMANKIVSVLRHGSLHQTLKENGLTEVQNLSWEKSARKAKQIYKSLIENTIL